MHYFQGCWPFFPRPGPAAAARAASGTGRPRPTRSRPLPLGGVSSRRGLGGTRRAGSGKSRRRRSGGSAAVMPAKRALKLETFPKQNPHQVTPLKTRKKNVSLYSPITGTCQISLFSSPTSHNVQKLGNGLSNGDSVERNDSEISLSGRGQPLTEKDDKFMMLQSEIEKSLVRFLKMRQSLTSLQALEGSGELENIFGVSDSSCNLKAEVQKTKALMIETEKLELLKRSNAKHPARECVQSGNSYEFLKSLINKGIV